MNCIYQVEYPSGKIISKRFHIRPYGFGQVSIRDRDAPYHCHMVDVKELPGVNTLGSMTEQQYDRIIFDLIYGESE